MADIKTLLLLCSWVILLLKPITMNGFIKNYFNDANKEITKPETLWKQPALAKTLELSRDKVQNGFYRGEVANEIEILFGYAIG